MDGWERFKTITTAISVIAIPVVVAWLGNNYTSAIKEREIQGRFVELAVNILKETPDESKKNIRQWATEIINKYSGVPLNEETRKDLIKSIPLVGRSAVNLDATDVRTKETNIGNLITDMMRDLSGADVAIINAGSIRSSIKAGPITESDIYGAFPFDNKLVILKVSGRQIRAALEHGISGTERTEGAFPQVSGVKFTYDLSVPAGQRLRSVTINGKPLESDKIYSVATNDFLAAGGDGYSAFVDASPVIRGSIRDLLVDYIRIKGQISPREEGRIQSIR